MSNLQPEAPGVMFSVTFHLKNKIQKLLNCVFISSKIWSFLSLPHPKKVIHAFIISGLIFVIHCIQAKETPTNRERKDHISNVLASLHWSPLSFKILLITFKALHG